MTLPQIINRDSWAARLSAALVTCGKVTRCVFFLILGWVLVAYFTSDTGFADTPFSELTPRMLGDSIFRIGAGLIAGWIWFVWAFNTAEFRPYRAWGYAGLLTSGAVLLVSLS